jgi:hypothetical protein
VPIRATSCVTIPTAYPEAHESENANPGWGRWI